MSKDETPAKPPTPQQATLHGVTKFGPASFFNGTLEGHEDVIVEGRFQGKISLPANSLTVGRGAKVEAEIQVRSLVLHGELAGTVAASERVMISETARMNGDIQTARISISNGAQFKGGIKIEKS